MDELSTIYSMTGYAVVAKELPKGSLNLELRSVNSRYLDIQFRLPDEFRLLEGAMREFLAARLKRGKIECRVNFSRFAGAEDLQHINADLLQKLLELDLNTLEPYVNGPFTPDLATPISKLRDAVGKNGWPSTRCRSATGRARRSSWRSTRPA